MTDSLFLRILSGLLFSCVLGACVDSPMVATADESISDQSTSLQASSCVATDMAMTWPGTRTGYGMPTPPSYVEEEDVSDIYTNVIKPNSDSFFHSWSHSYTPTLYVRIDPDCGPPTRVDFYGNKFGSPNTHNSQTKYDSPHPVTSIIHNGNSMVVYKFSYTGSDKLRSNHEYDFVVRLQGGADGGASGGGDIGGFSIGPEFEITNYCLGNTTPFIEVDYDVPSSEVQDIISVGFAGSSSSSYRDASYEDMNYKTFSFNRYYIGTNTDRFAMNGVDIDPDVSNQGCWPMGIGNYPAPNTARTIVPLSFQCKSSLQDMRKSKTIIPSKNCGYATGIPKNSSQVGKWRAD